MITLISICVWLFALVVSWRVLRDRGDAPPDARAPRWTWLLLILVAIPLLARPHELLFSGQDPGVYINAAGAYHRHQSVFYIDPMLAQVPLEARYDFMFGHPGYRLMKDSCLEIKDWVSARVGPRFPALFSILLSPLIGVGTPPLALLIPAAFALLTGLCLWVLMERLLRQRWAGAVAATCYLGAPLLIWHARAPRPELMASFFSLAGFALLLRAWRAPAWQRWPDLVLGALCVALAPFFHITAWCMATSAALLMVGWLARGRADGLLYPPVALAGLAAFAWQTLAIGDQYQLTRYIVPVLAHPRALTAGIIFLLAAPPLALWAVRGLTRTRGGRAWTTLCAKRSTAWVTRGAAALLLLVACGVVYRAHLPIAAREFEGYDYHYLYPTDLHYALLMVTAPMALMALAGLLVLLLDPRRSDATSRLAWLLWLLPGALLVGTMYDFFMSRYLVPFFLPLMASGLAALLTAPFRRDRGEAAPTPAPLSTPWPRARIPGLVLILVTAVLLALPWRHRLGMVTTTEYRGLADTLAKIAAPIRAEDGMMLVEYARHAAPLEHLFGIPLLSLDNETRNDYRAALAAWAGIMAAHPDRAAFFMTPYPPPFSEHFQFSLVSSNTVPFARLPAGRFRLPGRATAPTTDFLCYRMALNPPPPPTLPWVHVPNAGNMGRVAFARVGSSTWRLAGPPLTPGTPTDIALADMLAVQPNDHLLLFMHPAAGSPSPEGPWPTAPTDAVFARTDWTPLADGWHVLQLRAMDTGAVDKLRFRIDAGTAVAAELWCLRGTDARPVALRSDAPGPHGIRLRPREILPAGALLTPRATRESPVVFAALMAPSPSASPHPWQAWDADIRLGTRHPPSQRWSWQVWVLPAAADPAPGCGWLHLAPDLPPPSLAPTIPTARLAGAAVFAIIPL